MDLVKKEDLGLSIPIKSIPEDRLNTIILTQFTVWVSKLLSLTDETSAERLEVALPAIKEHCWSMGFQEITKMFEMYADGKLSVKPLPNYFDRILLGKIVEAYKQQKPIKKKEIKMPEPTQEEKDLLIYEGVIFCFDNWVQNKDIINGQLWVHDHLQDLDLFKFTDNEKNIMWNKSKENLLALTKTLDRDLSKEIFRELENNKSTKRINEYKKIRLKRYFATIYAKDKHIKDFIN